MNQKKKIGLSVLFLFSLCPMLLNQYGGKKGVQEISGLINVTNSLGILSILAYVAGIWFPFQNKKWNKVLGAFGVIGILLSEIVTYFTWYIKNITGKMSLQYSIQFAFFEFYIGLFVSFLMVIAYFAIMKKNS